MARWPLNVHGTDSNRGGRARVQRRLRRDMSCVCDREAKIVNFQQKLLSLHRPLEMLEYAFDRMGTIGAASSLFVR